MPSSPLKLFHRKSRVQIAPEKCAHSSSNNKSESSLMRLRRKELYLGDLLGEGGFGQVYSIQLKKTKKTKKDSRKLALKQVREDLLNDIPLFTTAARALVKESHIMTVLKGHPNILQIRGIGCDSKEPMPTKNGFDSFFLITDALKETMTNRIKLWNTMIPRQEHWSFKLQYALQTAMALLHCHQRQIVYRDCKMDNLGFLDEHTVQLYDFGLSRHLPLGCASSSSDQEDPVFHMTICGTQRWMAPEVFKSHYNCKADTYSWAMTVVEIITGQKPFPHMTLPVHKVLVLEGGGRPNVDSYPFGLQYILRHAWASSVEKRWNMEQVCTALQAHIHDIESAGLLDTKASPPLQDEAHAKNLGDVQKQPLSKSRPVLALAA